jgi:hypothetical protein
MDGSPSTIPHLPNELRIRILSFIDDPHFLWATCRKVSRAFKEWSEEQYARDFLPKLRLDMSVTPPIAQMMGIGFQRSEFLFRFKELSQTDSALVLLEPEGMPYSVLWDHQLRKVPDEDAYNLLADLFGPLGQFAECQLLPESVLGLRPQGQDHVCPCRSIRDGTTRKKCQRYSGIGRFFAWREEEKVLRVRWKAMLDHVHHARCVCPVPVVKKRVLESIPYRSPVGKEIP